MQPLRDMEIGAMFWAGPDPRETIREVEEPGGALRPAWHPR